MALTLRPSFLPGYLEPWLDTISPNWQVNIVLSMNDYAVMDIQLSFVNMMALASMITFILAFLRVFQYVAIVIWLAHSLISMVVKFVKLITTGFMKVLGYQVVNVHTGPQILPTAPVAVAAPVFPPVPAPNPANQAFMVMTGEVMTQSQTTYTAVRGCSDARFKPWNNYQGEVYRVR